MWQDVVMVINKDRHYFDKEWPQLLHGPLTVLEVCNCDMVYLYK